MTVIIGVITLVMFECSLCLSKFARIMLLHLVEVDSMIFYDRMFRFVSAMVFHIVTVSVIVFTAISISVIFIVIIVCIIISTRMVFRMNKMLLVRVGFRMNKMLFARVGFRMIEVLVNRMRFRYIMDRLDRRGTMYRGMIDRGNRLRRRLRRCLNWRRLGIERSNAYCFSTGALLIVQQTKLAKPVSNKQCTYISGNFQANMFLGCFT